MVNERTGPLGMRENERLVAERGRGQGPQQTTLAQAATEGGTLEQGGEEKRGSEEEEGKGRPISERQRPPVQIAAGDLYGERVWAGGCSAHTKHITKAKSVAATSERAVLVCVGARYRLLGANC
jgi:hypothetical protein